jgi:hypothetical protein
MALALEVNDAGLLALVSGAVRPLPESPGVALLAEDGATTGAAALARAYLEPRAVCDDYWDRLDTEPLEAPFPPGFTRADLAFAHLRALAEDLPSRAAGAETILVVPGSWPKERLGLLLSVARAAGLDVRGLVDAAVAASCFAPRHSDRLHLDLTRHGAVLTRLGDGPGPVRTRVTEAPGLGTVAFERAYVDHVVGRFVAETRFDPRHSGPSEQALHDRLPEWRRELRSLPTCPAVFAAGSREHRIEVAMRDFENAGAPLHRLLGERVLEEAAPGGRPLLLLSARAVAEPGLAEALSEATGLETSALAYDAALVAALRHRERIMRTDPALPFVTRLPPWSDAAPVAPPAVAPAP